jgi:hypothetical protein
MLYGSRAAIEEVILQAGSEHIQPLIIGVEEPSHTPVTKFLGVNIHSGDILVSRGGAPTSALISRGSDYPGNFSHIALVYVDKETNIPFIVESHIEIGVAISSLEDYIKDKKLRVMVLRPRSDLPQLIADPLLPHKAAKAAIDRAKNEHIPYDFEMDLTDNQKLFCSEVASSVYKELELDLWSFKSTISNQGTAKLLSTFGVKYFETQEPSDLEYDPQLVVVAEWRDYQTLFQDHIDNVIVDAVIEWVDKGNEISHDWYLLPFARVIKLYSGILNQFNLAGPIPEGMSATSALKHEAFNSLHEKVEKSVVIKSEQFRLKNNYVPPYWKLVSFANEYFNTDQ